jgi:hypothetical protein
VCAARAAAQSSRPKAILALIYVLRKRFQRNSLRKRNFFEKQGINSMVDSGSKMKSHEAYRFGKPVIGLATQGSDMGMYFGSEIVHSYVVTDYSLC